MYCYVSYSYIYTICFTSSSVCSTLYDGHQTVHVLPQTIFYTVLVCPHKQQECTQSPAKCDKTI